MSTWGLRKITSLNHSADREIENHIGESGRTGSLAPPTNISIKQTITNGKFGSSIYRFDDIPLKGIISLHSTNTCGIALVPITLALLLCNDVSRIGLTSKASRLFTGTFRWLSYKRCSLKSCRNLNYFPWSHVCTMVHPACRRSVGFGLSWRWRVAQMKFFGDFALTTCRTKFVLLKYTEHGKLPKLLSVTCTVHVKCLNVLLTRRWFTKRCSPRCWDVGHLHHLLWYQFVGVLIGQFQ